MFDLYVNVCIMTVDEVHGGQKRESDPLKLESQWLRVVMWRLGMEPGSCARGVSDLHC